MCLSQFGLNFKKFCQKIAIIAYRPNVQYLKTTSRKFFKQIVIQIRLRFWTIQHFTCAG